MQIMAQKQYFFCCFFFLHFVCPLLDYNKSIKLKKCCTTFDLLHMTERKSSHVIYICAQKLQEAIKFPLVEGKIHWITIKAEGYQKKLNKINALTKSRLRTTHSNKWPEVKLKERGSVIVMAYEAAHILQICCPLDWLRGGQHSVPQLMCWQRDWYRLISTFLYALGVDFKFLTTSSLPQ